METAKKPAFDANTMATTVGANSLNVEAIVSQPSNTQDELMVDGLDYMFDQAKFEEYLSSSLSRSSSPKRRRILSPMKTEHKDFLPIVVKASPYNIIPATPKAEGSAHQSATILTKRALQRQRQKLARQFAKALEPMDGVHYHTNSCDQRCQQTTAPQCQSISIPAKNEWVLVKRTCLTKKERAQKRRARAARARAIIRKAQELNSTEGSARSRQIWIPNSTQAPTSVQGRDSRDYRGQGRDSRDCRGQDRDSRGCRGNSRVTSNCRATSPCRARMRGTPNCCATSPCRAQKTVQGRDTPSCLGQGVVSASFSHVPADTSSISVFSRLGPQSRRYDQPATKRTHHYTGGWTRGSAVTQQEATSIPINARLSIPQGVRESTYRKRVMTHVETTTNDEVKPSLRSNNRYPQKKTCLSIKKNVTLGGGSAICGKPRQPRHEAGGGNTREKTINKIDCSCLCAQLIKTLLSGCACSESNVHLQRASVFERLSQPATKGPKRRSRRFRRRKRALVQQDEFPEVTINVVDKGKGPATDSDPDFTPEGKVSTQISQRLSRLQLRAMRRRDYRRMHEGESSEDEGSDACSAIASDDTMSSVGRPREAFTITPETLAQMLQEALAKQKEELKAEMKTEMELAMQQMKELQIQKTTVTEFNQQAGPSNQVIDSDPEVDESLLMEPSPKKNTGKAPAIPTGKEPATRTDKIPTVPTENDPDQSEDDSGKMKELEGKINALISAQEVKRTGIPCPYPREWDSIPYPSKFNLINFTPFDGRGSPTQHLIYFKSHLGVISGNEPLMIRSFVGTLRGAAFNWYRRLKAGSINCWDDMESSFLSSFFDDDTEVSIRTLLDEKQNGGETTDAFVKRFRNKAINCKDPITEEFILQTCHNNLSIDLLEVMGVVPPTTWKELKLRGEQAERFLKRKKNERGEPTTGPSNSNFASRDKKKASIVAVDQKLQQQHLRQRKTSDRRLQEEYSFKDEEVPAIFKHLLENNKIKLPPITNQEEVSNTSDPKYCAYHRRILHPTKDCLALKAIIQALVEAGVLTPK